MSLPLPGRLVGRRRMRWSRRAGALALAALPVLALTAAREPVTLAAPDCATASNGALSVGAPVEPVALKLEGVSAEGYGNAFKPAETASFQYEPTYRGEVVLVHDASLTIPIAKGDGAYYLTERDEAVADSLPDALPAEMRTSLEAGYRRASAVAATHATIGLPLAARVDEVTAVGLAIGHFTDAYDIAASRVFNERIGARAQELVDAWAEGDATVTWAQGELVGHATRDPARRTTTVTAGVRTPGTETFFESQRITVRHAGGTSVLTTPDGSKGCLTLPELTDGGQQEFELFWEETVPAGSFFVGPEPGPETVLRPGEYAGVPSELYDVARHPMLVSASEFVVTHRLARSIQALGYVYEDGS